MFVCHVEVGDGNGAAMMIGRWGMECMDGREELIA